ncbi:MAG: ATP-binding cassette domain-containing protein [Geodermatophilaceae bacterium]|nr:ATP-binding cassette domain-containing protein [Geodermatophilaceae bacterium]
MIRFDHVSVRYADAAADALSGVDLTVPDGELCLVVGRTGSGKSTLLGAASGHVPHFTGGRLSGRVLVDGRDTREFRPRELADVVGVVGQSPVDGFVTDSVEDELAFTMESLGMQRPVMRRRVEETLDLLGLAELRDRPLAQLSAGQQQRVAIGSALTAHPRVLVLDEPTSALDPGAAEDVLAALHRLVHDLGITVLLSEHRLERVVQYADSVISLAGPGQPPRYGVPGDVLGASEVAPPVVHLGRLAGWSPLPVSVRDARRQAVDLRSRLSTLAAPATSRAGGSVVLRTSGLTVRYRGGPPVLHDLDLTLAAGQVSALMGRNGAGKSTLLWTLQGALKPLRGTVHVGTEEPSALDPADRRTRVALVPQDPTDLLYLDTVGTECRQSDTESQRPARETRALLDRFTPGVDDDTDPRDLSEGQRLSLVLAIQLAARPRVLLLDEPTRGLDYLAKDRLAAALTQLSRDGTAVLLATHDVEFVATVADRVLVLAGGEMITDGATRDVVLSSPTYAPQVAKVLAPDAWLTVAEVARALPVPA